MSLDTFLQSNASDLSYPNIRPTLNLNFAKTKTLDPRITFSRNSIGTYVDVDGYIKTAVANQPRFDHDPLTGKCLGLLMEEERTNSFSNSKNLVSPSTGANTGAFLSAFTTDILNPENTLTDVKTVQTTAGNSAHGITIGSGFDGGTTRTGIFSIFLKKANWRYILIESRQPFGGYPIGIFDFDTETGMRYQKYANGWYRIFSSSYTWGGNNPAVTISLTSSATQFTGVWTATGEEKVYIYGPQVEYTSLNAVTSYIPTSGSTVTRLADSATITGTNFSSWYNTSEGTLLSIGTENFHRLSSTSLEILSNQLIKNVVSNIFYYPKVIQYATLKSMNANGYSYPSSIVTAGLILYLDAGNTQSYSGSGTTWTDLSGNGRNGTLTNGPTYSSSNGGSIVFDGVDDLMNLSSPLNFSTNSGFTMCLFLQANPTQVNSAWNYFHSRVSPDIEIGTFGTSGTSFIFKDNTVNSTVNSGNVVSSWSYIAFGTNETTRTPFIQTFNSSGNFLSTSSTAFSNTTIGFERLFSTGTGGGPAGTQYYGAKCAVIQAYNRSLTATEIQQNFNALRGRFGI